MTSRRTHLPSDSMSPIEQKQQQVETLMRLAPVIPVVIINDVKAAVPMARACMRVRSG